MCSFWRRPARLVCRHSSVAAVIVLSLGTTAFGLALAYRSWRLTGHDEVVDDVEDRRLAKRVQEYRVSADDSGAEGTEDPGIAYDQENS